MKRVIITIDYEGRWGMPFAAPYDLATTTHELLDLFDRYHAKAVFFAVGQLVEHHPELIIEIHRRGHEIGLHGYAHEHLHQLTATQLHQLMVRLQLVADTVEQLTGRRPTGFRAPYLMGPIFYQTNVYRALAAQGYTWVSNREIRQPEELTRPGGLPWLQPALRLKPLRQLLLLALNPSLIARETPAPGPRGLTAARWLLGPQAPFRRPEGLTEYPLHAPLDCDLVGFPRPTIPSPEASIAFAIDTIMAAHRRSGAYFTLNHHDWISGTANRLTILEHVLARLTPQPDTHFWLPGRRGE